MRNRKMVRRLLSVATLCTFPAVFVVTGCGGGGGGNSGPSLPTVVVPDAALVGSYTGTYKITSGPDSGDTGIFTMTVSSSGKITGSSDGDTDFKGVTTTSGGAITLKDDEKDTDVTITGQLTAGSGGTVTGTATFTSSDGNKGTVTLTKSTTTVTSAQIVGTWKQTAIGGPSIPDKACPATVPVGTPNESCGSNDKFVFKSDGGLTFTQTGESPLTGKWSLSGSTMTIKVDTSTETEAVSISGNKMRLSELTYHDTDNPNEDSDHIVAVLTKQ